MESSGKFLCSKGNSSSFDSYVHYDAIKFKNYNEAVIVCNRYKYATVEFL